MIHLYGKYLQIGASNMLEDILGYYDDLKKPRVNEVLGIIEKEVEILKSILGDKKCSIRFVNYENDRVHAEIRMNTYHLNIIDTRENTKAQIIAWYKDIVIPATQVMHN